MSLYPGLRISPDILPSRNCFTSQMIPSGVRLEESRGLLEGGLGVSWIPPIGTCLNRGKNLMDHLLTYFIFYLFTIYT